ncbi:MAG: universal stress protein [bacterium]
MSNIKKILMPTDFSKNANQALRYAALLADRLRAELTLLHVVTLYQDDSNDPDYHFPDLKEIYGKLEKSAANNMDKFTHEFERLQVNKVTVRGISPAEEIVNYEILNDVDLIVMGTHGRSAVGRFLVGSVTEKVVRHVSSPVLTVAHQEKEPYSLPEIKNILVPLDFSDYSKNVFQTAIKFAEVFDASLKFLHVVDCRVHPVYYVTGEQPILKTYPNLLEESMKSLQEFVRAEIPWHVPGEFYVREGNPHVEIVKFSKKEPTDLILMATYGLSGLERMLIGSTTEKVIRKADHPIFIVKANVD